MFYFENDAHFMRGAHQFLTKMNGAKVKIFITLQLYAIIQKLFLNLLADYFAERR